MARSAIKPIRVVLGIVRDQHRLLVAKRPQDKSYSGYWELPGGKIEIDEGEEAALKRELAEELAIAVTRARFLFAHHYAHPDRIIHLAIWAVEQYSGEPQGHENQHLRWVNQTEFASLRLLPGTVPIATKIQTFLLSGE